MQEPSQKHLYQARAILRRLQRANIERLELNKNSDDTRLISHFASRVKKLSDALGVLDFYDLDNWAKHQMTAPDKQFFEREFEIDFPKS